MAAQINRMGVIDRLSQGASGKSRLKIGIHGTQGSAGFFTGTAALVGSGTARRLVYQGAVTIVLRDVYEFDT